jgi:formylglycine-generating enzyme required for sulfatase activity
MSKVGFDNIDFGENSIRKKVDDFECPSCKGKRIKFGGENPRYVCMNCEEERRDDDSRVLRGGSWCNYIYALRVTNRSWLDPTLSINNLGFRCANSAHDIADDMVLIDDFYIDKYLVTNKKYRQFIEATGHPNPEYWDNEDFNQPNQPVVDVSWYDAVAYCQWVGKRLPTEQEWEKAARGGLVDKEYPWGDEQPDESRANFGRNVSHPTPVGQYPPNGYGLYDMAGNVWEWCSDWYIKDYYAKSPQQNPRGPKSGTARACRGGSWGFDINDLRVASRYRGIPTSSFNFVGFRCARDTILSIPF